MKRKRIYDEKKHRLGRDEFDPSHSRFRVTMFIDLPTLKKIRAEAAEKGLPYQTYINQLLRNHAVGDDESRIRAIVRDELRKLKG